MTKPDQPPPLGVDPATAAWIRRRQARLDRWRRPLSTPWDYLRAWTNMLFVDHAIFRLLFSNTHKFGKEAWRSSQPMPHHLRRFARQGGRSVVSLRGGQTFGSLPLELETCAQLGLHFETFVLRSRALPSREELLAADALFLRLEHPVLFHCKSGADRAGFLAALYLALFEGRPVEEARQQLSVWYGHFRQSKTGILDAFFEVYLADAKGRLSLREWIAQEYDPEAVTARFQATPWGSLLGDRLLRRE
ncbi:MAG: tyrosine-protein phosphatase [Pseudomonadota bacterium]